MRTIHQLLEDMSPEERARYYERLEADGRAEKELIDKLKSAIKEYQKVSETIGIPITPATFGLMADAALGRALREFDPDITVDSIPLRLRKADTRNKVFPT